MARRQKLDGVSTSAKSLVPFLHFAATFEDINNLAYALMLRDVRQLVRALASSYNREQESLSLSAAVQQELMAIVRELPSSGDCPRRSGSRSVPQSRPSAARSADGQGFSEADESRAQEEVRLVVREDLRDDQRG